MVRYNLPKLTELIYRLLADFLITERGYSAAIKGIPVPSRASKGHIQGFFFGLHMRSPCMEITFSS